MPHTCTNTAPATLDRGLGAKLSKGEKTHLAIEARKAYAKMEGNGATDESFDEFRHRIALQACGRRISEALRADYSALAAAFAAIRGDTGRAFHIAQRGETEGRRIAAHKLKQALSAAGLADGYAATICLQQFKTGIESASTKQLWSLFYTITNRGRSKARKTARA
jgi:hypothetical protein